MLVPRIDALVQLLSEARAVREGVVAGGASKSASLRELTCALCTAAEAAEALARLLRAGAAHGVYRPREDASGVQRALIAAALASALGIAQVIAALPSVVTLPELRPGVRAAHAAACAAFDALLVLDPLMVRPNLPAVVALLAAAPDALAAEALGGARGPAALLHTLIHTTAAERQLPTLLRTFAATAATSAVAAGPAGSASVHGAPTATFNSGGHNGLGALMGAAACWQLLAEMSASVAEAQAPELCDDALNALEALVGKGDYARRGCGEEVWQLACLLSTVFDAIPISAHVASVLQSAAKRGLGVADTLAAATSTGAGRCGKRHRPHATLGLPMREHAAAMLLWRASAALNRACAEITAPGGWGARMDMEQPCPALQQAIAVLTVSDDDAKSNGLRMRGHDGTACVVIAATATDAVAAYHMVAVDAVAHEALWLHLDLQVATMSAHHAASGGSHSLADSDAGSGSPFLGGDLTKPLRRLHQRLNLLTTWTAADGMRTLRAAEPCSRIAACGSLLTGRSACFIAHCATLCDHAALIDAYAPLSGLETWLTVLWQAACTRPDNVGGSSKHEGFWTAADDTTRTSVPALAWRMLRSAELYELPRARLALLPSGLRWLQKQMPNAASFKGKRDRAWVKFILRELPDERTHAVDCGSEPAGGAHADAYAEGNADGDEDGIDAAESEWASLLHASDGAHGSSMSVHAWSQLARALRLMGSLPHEWLPVEQFSWLLPKLLIVAQLALPATGHKEDAKTSDVGALWARLYALENALVAACALVSCAPVVTRACVRGKAGRQVLKWCTQLPQSMAESMGDTHADVLGRISERGAALMRALTAAALDGASQRAVKAGEARQLLPSCWRRWLDDSSESLCQSADASRHAVTFAALAAHLAAIAAALPEPPPPSSRRRAAAVEAAAGVGRSRAVGYDEYATKTSSAVLVARVSADAALVESVRVWLQTIHARLIGASAADVGPASCVGASHVLQRSDRDAAMPSAVLDFVATWLRCTHALREHAAAPLSPPYLRAAVQYSVRVLKDRVDADTDDVDEMPLAEKRREKVAWALVDTLSDRPSALPMLLPVADRRALVMLLLGLLRPLAAYAALTPSGRPRVSDAHTPLGMLRRLLIGTGRGASGGEADDLFRWTLNHLLLHQNAPAPAPVRCAALLGLALVCAASAPAHVTALTDRLGEVLHTLVSAAMRTTSGAHDAGLAEQDTARTCAVQALTALVTNDQLPLAASDGATLLLAAGSVAAHVELHAAPCRGASVAHGIAHTLPGAPLPSAGAFNASYYLLIALLRQRPRLVHAAAPLLLAAVRGLLHALGRAAPGAPGHAERGGTPETPRLPLECARNVRRLLEAIAGHKKVLMRHGSYLLADIVAVLKERPLPARAMEELLPGIHALLGMCSEVEVQACYAVSDGVRQRMLISLLESYEKVFKHRGQV